MMNEKSESIQELRQRVSARDKSQVGSKPPAEGIKLIKERYGVTEETATTFVAWQKSIAGGEGTVSNPSERWHLKFDEIEGVWRKVPQPGDPDHEGSKK